MSVLGVILLLTFVSGVLCLTNKTGDRYMYYSDYGNHEVYRLDMATGQRITLPITGLISPLSVDYDHTTGYLYIANVQLHTNDVTKFFLKYHLETGRTETKYLPRSYLISAMALDPVSQLIYYAERTGQVIIALTTDFKHETVIVDELLVKPSALVLDIDRRFVYWADWSKTKPKIGKANMDGTDRDRLIVDELKEPYALAVDFRDDRIYWADNSPNRTRIERSKTDGRQRETVVQLQSPDFVMSIAIDEIYFYWTLSKRGVVRRTMKNDLSVTDTIGIQYANNKTDFRSLRLVDKTPPPIGSNACSGPARGGCQHVCIPSGPSRVCMCDEGYVLRPDGISCTEAPFKRGLVTTDVNRRTLIVHDLDNDVTRRLTDRWHDHDNPLDVVFDPNTREVYWQDRFRKGVYRSCLPKPCYKKIKEYREKESQLTSMALDPGQKMMYLTDYGLKKMFRLSYSGTVEEVVLTNLTSYVTGIALDLSTRRVYWANFRSSIEVADMLNGTRRKEIIVTDVYVSGMEVDSKAGLLYYLDFTNNRLMVYNMIMHSKEKTLFHGDGTESLYGLTLGDGILYFSDREKQNIYEFDTKTNVTMDYGRRTYKRVVGITYFNLGKKIDYQGPLISAITGTNGLNGLDLVVIVGICAGAAFLIIIVLIITCAVVISRRSRRSRAEPTPEAAPPVDPPLPLDMMATGQQRPEPPLGVYAELFCDPEDDEVKKAPLPDDDVATGYPPPATQPPGVLPTEHPPPYERY